MLKIEDRPWTVYWIKKFRNDQEYAGKRFKRLERGYPPFQIDEDLIDVVLYEDFIKIEEDRIPLFIGCQFGDYPRINKQPGFFNGQKIIAILGKSLLSGHVAGVGIYLIGEHDQEFKFNKIAYFQNTR